MSFDVNEEQEAIISAPKDKNICIIARAGSGKTTTILYRILNLCKNHDVELKDVVLTTFTVNAAHDMSGRLKKLMDENGIHTEGLTIGTLDSISQRIIKYVKGDMSKYDFTQYQRLFLEFLRTDAGVVYARTIKYFFFDEFQDCNLLQYEITRELYKHGVIITVVGDDAQNIYSFRDSDVKFILGFENEFIGAQIFGLTRNYRSTGDIVNVANQSLYRIFIAQNIEGKPFTQMSAIKPIKGDRPILRYYKDIWSECKDIAQKIKYTLIGADKIAPANIAILSRNGGPLKVMEFNLKKYGIDCLYIDKIDKEFTKLDPNSPKLLLTTIHSAKGLEWDYVFIISCNDKIFPGNKTELSEIEDRRLFYVAVTRPRKSLMISYAGDWSKKVSKEGIVSGMYVDMRRFPTRYIQEVPANMFQIVGCDPNGFRRNKDSQIIIKTGVTDLLAELTEIDFDQCIRRDLVIECTGVEKLYKSFGYEFFIKNNNAFTVFGHFIETLINRQFGITRSRLAEGIIYRTTITIPEEQACSILIKKKGRRVHDLCYMDDNEISDEIVHLTFEQQALIWRIIYDIRYRATSHDLEYSDIYIETKRIPFELHEFIHKKLGAAYRNFRNENINWDKVIYETWLIALCNEIHRDRWGVIYMDINDYDLWKYMPMYQRMYQLYVLPRIDCIVHSQVRLHIDDDKFQSKYENRITGAADLIFEDLGEIVDIKVTRNGADNHRNILQVLSYYILYNASKSETAITEVIKLSLFNPLLGEIHEYKIDPSYLDNWPNVLKIMVESRDRKLDRYFERDISKN